MRFDPAFNLASLENDLEAASSLLKALGNTHRLNILCELQRHERSVGELEKLIGISQSALSQHLARLRRENLVKTRRDAQSIYYFLDDDRALTVMRAVNGILGTKSQSADEAGMSMG